MSNFINMIKASYKASKHKNRNIPLKVLSKLETGSFLIYYLSRA